MEFLRVRLQAPAASLDAVAEFYAKRLGIKQLDRTSALVAFGIGETRLELAPSETQPFYHFALLAPGNRFGAVLDWIGERAELLPDQETGDVVFDFSNWQAEACYFHDPAGNIVELIAHRGVDEARAEGGFSAAELIGFSELGLVGDVAAMARPLRLELGLELWDGTVEGPGRLAFVGEKARTLILSPTGRGWLPTGRPAEVHPVDAVLSGSPTGEALMEESRYRIRRGAASRPLDHS
jgi:catechol 2,3-dioxygenase-like lactoylglutathione lyase family enzyme